MHGGGKNAIKSSNKGWNVILLKISAICNAHSGSLIQRGFSHSFDKDIIYLFIFYPTKHISIPVSFSPSFLSTEQTVWVVSCLWSTAACSLICICYKWSYQHIAEFLLFKMLRYDLNKQPVWVNILSFLFTLLKTAVCVALQLPLLDLMIKRRFVLNLLTTKSTAS